MTPGPAPTPDPLDRPCLVCGGARYERTPVLWQGLIDAWGLTPDEAESIDRQQGVRCTRCRCNLRSIALAGGICDAFSFDGTFDDWVGTTPTARVLEINGAGDLCSRLARLGSRTLVHYPKTDMAALPFDDGSFDLVVHSDTLEHVPDPGAGLRECRRVLARGGTLAMTVPTVPARMTRSRAGLPPSYHGDAARDRDDHLVHTEFGADVWAMIARAGFERIGCRIFDWPSGICWTARR